MITARTQQSVRIHMTKINGKYYYAAALVDIIGIINWFAVEEDPVENKTLLLGVGTKTEEDANKILESFLDE